MATTKKVTNTSKPTMATKTTSKTSKTEPKKSVVISKKVVTGSTNKTAKSIPVNRKVVYVDSSKTIPSTPVKEVTPKTTTTVSKPQVIDLTTHQSSNNVPTNNQSQAQQQTTQVNKTYPINNQPQVSKTPPKPNQSNLNQPKPKQKKKKHRWIEAVTAIVMFGTVLGGIGYHVYKLATTEQTKEEYSRDVESKTDNITIDKKQVNNDYVITLKANDKTYEIDSIVEIKIGDYKLESTDYKFDKSKQTITFSIDFLKKHPDGKIEITTTIAKIVLFTIDTPSKTIEEGKDFELSVELKEGKDGDEITWKSSNEKIATVEVISGKNIDKTSKCKVTVNSFTKEETAETKSVTITASTSVSKKSVSCSVTVTKKKVQATYEYYGFDKDGNETEEISDIAYYKVKCSNKDECGTAIIEDTYNNKPITGFYFDGKEGAFEMCARMESIEFKKPENIKTIDRCSFQYCSALKSFPVLPNLESIGYLAFGDCNALSSFTIPSSVKVLEPVFLGNPKKTNFKSLTFEDKENTIWDLQDEGPAFGYDVKDKTSTQLATDYIETYSACNWHKRIIEKCIIEFVGYDDEGNKQTETSKITKYKVKCGNNDHRSITSAKIPNVNSSDENKPVIGIEDYGFADCINLSDLQFEENPENFTIIGDHSFSNCSSLKMLNISNFLSLETIDYCAFSGCCNMQSFDLAPASVCKLKIIGEKAFENCSKLVEFNGKTSGLCNLPDSLTTLGNLAFAITNENYGTFGTTPFTSVKFNNTSTNLNISKNSFGYCDKNKTDLFSYDDNNCYYIKDSNSGNENYIFCGLMEGEALQSWDVKIKTGTVITASYSMGYFTSLGITFPDSIRTIGYGTFAHTDFNTINFDHESGTLWNIYQKTTGYGERVHYSNFNPSDEQSWSDVRTFLKDPSYKWVYVGK